MSYETQYLQLLRRVRSSPVRETRNGAVRSFFGARLECKNIAEEFPLLTTKRVWVKGVLEELAWFLRGSTNVDELRAKGIRIWDVNVHGADAGPIYGYQWRNFNGSGYDQIAEVLRLLRENPTSRRIFFSAWCPPQLAEMALPPCHVSYQFYVDEFDRVCCQTYQRSADVFLGLPFNMASAAFLTLLIAAAVQKTPGDVSLCLGDVHLYATHEEAADTQLSRVTHPPPRASVVRVSDDLMDVKRTDIRVDNYEHGGVISAPLC